MPRKIPDLEAKIIKAAGSLFVEKGYTEICMKEVARQVGTSVGNLYNYYPSKKDLFLASRQIWMQHFNAEFQKTVLNSGDPRRELEELLSQLMTGLESWGGLWEEFLASATRELKPDEIQFLLASMREESRTLIIAPLDKLLHQLSVSKPHLQQLLAAPGMRFASSIIATMKMLIRLYPTEKESNRAFIRTMLDFKKENTN